jgi:hypothetical protein
MEYYLRWCWSLLSTYGQYLQGSESTNFQESFRALIRAVSVYEQEIMRMSDENHFLLQFIQSQGRDFLEMKAATATVNVTADEQDKDERMLMKQPIRSIVGYRQKNVSSATAVATSRQEKEEPSDDRVMVDEETEELLLSTRQEEKKESKPKKKTKRVEEAEAEEVEEIVAEGGGESEDQTAGGRLRAKATKKGKKLIKKLRLHN